MNFLKFQIDSTRRDQRILSVREIKNEKDLEMARQAIKNLHSHLGTIILSDSESDGVMSMDDGEDVPVEISQMDSLFAHEHTFRTNVKKLRWSYLIVFTDWHSFQADGDRYFLNGSIKIKRDVVQTLKNMNSSPITNQAEYDYRFISYLIGEVFSRKTLEQSAVYSSNKTGKFNSLDKDQYSFVLDIFKERTSDKKRLQELPSHINKKCNALRQNLKNKKWKDLKSMYISWIKILACHYLITSFYLTESYISTFSNHFPRNSNNIQIENEIDEKKFIARVFIRLRIERSNRL